MEREERHLITHGKLSLGESSTSPDDHGLAHCTSLRESGGIVTAWRTVVLMWQGLS